MGGTGSAAFLWLSTLPPAIDCQHISSLAADGERLHCAQQAALSGKQQDLLAGVQLVKGWTADHPLYSQAQDLLEQWSRSLLRIAQTQADQNQLKTAINLARQIPASSPAYKEAQATVRLWRDQLNQGEKIYNRFQTALKNQAWAEARTQLQELAALGQAGWQARLPELRQQIDWERAGWQQLNQIRATAQAGTPEQLSMAIALVRQQMNPKTLVWKVAQADARQWNQSIQTQILGRFNQGDRAGAIAAVKHLPFDAPLRQEARHPIWLLRAMQADIQNQEIYRPVSDTVGPILAILTALRQTPPDHPLFPQAKTYQTRLGQQLQDLAQLQLASTIAQTRQIPVLQLAIQQAGQITANRPRRLHAQTLMAQWQRQIERIEDAPILERARQLAKPGSKPQLQAAISQASQIAPDRALRRPAQAQIARWNRQIEVLEDRPILEQARVAARKGDWQQAIQIAGQIKPNRALYEEAQVARDQWIAQIQMLQDQGILDEATALANQGRLTVAIEIASRIAPGRALYGVAQRSISRWAAERNEIWRSWDAQDNGNRTDDSSEPTPP